MDSLSPVIGQRLTLPARASSAYHYDRPLFQSSGKGFRKFETIRVQAAAENKVVGGSSSSSPPAAAVNKSIDFSDLDWKSKYQKDFEARFNIPHLTDVFPDAVSYPSTFCLKMRTPGNEDFAGGYPSDEEWHGYINNNDRMLLKIKKYFKEIGAPADVKYIDPAYMIRACRANASDGILCTVLGQNAVISSWSICWIQLHHSGHLQYSLSLLSHS